MAKNTAPKADATDDVTPADVTNPEGDEQNAPEVTADASSMEPTYVQFRRSFEFAPPETKPQRVTFEKGRVVSSQHYDLDLLMKQGAQLDVVIKDEQTGDYDVVADLNSL